MVPDLQELADELASLGFRIAYENWCWSTHSPTWKDIWNVVRAVDRPNVGLCLDTFQTAGSEWADPTRTDGHIDGITDDMFMRSLEELSHTVPPDKIYLLQISDAYKPAQPLEVEIESGIPARSRWSARCSTQRQARSEHCRSCRQSATPTPDY